MSLSLKDLLQKGRVLLLGEGDFSFTSSLTHCARPQDITATSYESEVTILKHKLASDNIACLREKGMNVLFNVNATEIHKMELLSSQQWDFVVFNFPHVGGKSNIKKNRKLLKDFFQSASQVIYPDGKVIVTLCKGQGGTAQDQPMRAWHDSWQVVAMATYGKLILNEVLPFKVVDYSVYSSTGFRSQDKGFHTENALTHVFVKSSPLIPDPSLPDQDAEHLTINDNRYLCPPYIARRIHRQLHLKESHPVSIVDKLIRHGITSKWNTVDIHGDLFPILMNSGSEQTSSVHNELTALHAIDNVERGVKMEASNSVNQQNLITEKFVSACVVEGSSTCDKRSYNLLPTVEKSNGAVFLRVSLLEHASQLIDLMSSHQMALLTGQVYERCPVDSLRLPFKHEIMGILSPSETMNILQENGWSQVKVLLDSAMENVGLETSVEDKSDKVQENFSTFLDLFEKQSLDVIKSGKIHAAAKERRPLGDVFVLKAKTNQDLHLVFLINLDSIASTVYEIKDLRQLWSHSERFFKQFDAQDINTNFKPFSLHVCSHSHDMSFWISSSFTEDKFFDLVRDVAVDYVSSLKLIDKYIEEGTGRVSLCYRFVFNACDQALSFDDAYRFFQNIRNTLPKKLNVVNR